VRLDILARTAAVGTMLALAMTLLYGLEPTDPNTFGTTIAALFAMALLAGYIPALRTD